MGAVPVPGWPCVRGGGVWLGLGACPPPLPSILPAGVFPSCRWLEPDGKSRPS